MLLRAYSYVLTRLSFSSLFPLLSLPPSFPLSPLTHRYPGFFVNVMMNEELELQVPDADDNPWKSGAITFSAFVVFGVVPLLGYVPKTEKR